MIAFLIGVLVTEALTEILVNSAITFNFRAWVAQKSKFFNDLLSCGYCTSVWVACPVAFFAAFTITGNPIVDFVACWFAIHRLSNLFHGAAVRLMKRAPMEFVISIMNVPENNVLSPQAVEIEDE